MKCNKISLTLIHTNHFNFSWCAIKWEYKNFFIIVICCVYLVSRMKSVTCSFFGCWFCAHERLTDREVKLVIIGRLGGSGTSWMTNSIISKGDLSLTVQEKSPLSLNCTGLIWRLKLFEFKYLCGGERRRKKIKWYCFMTLDCTALTLSCFCCCCWSDDLSVGFASPIWYFAIIVWLDFQVNFSIFENDFSFSMSHTSVTFAPAFATILFNGRFSASVHVWEENIWWKITVYCDIFGHHHACHSRRSHKWEMLANKINFQS